jgi:hypothetical protein
MPHPSPCTIPRGPRGNPDNLSPTQTYQLAHSVRCRLMLTAERPDRNLRFVLGHAFTLDKIMLRLVEIEDEDEKPREPTPPPIAAAPSSPGRVSFRDAATTKRQRDEKLGIAPGDESRKRASPPPPPARHDGMEDSDTSSDDDEDEECLQLTLTTSHIKREPPVSTVPVEAAPAAPAPAAPAPAREPEPEPAVEKMALPHLVPSSESDSDSDSDEEPRPRISDSVLETIIEEDGDEELAELYETVASCPCHGKDAPVIERIWEIPQDVLEEEQRKYDEKKSTHKKAPEKKKPGRRLGAGRRMGVVRVIG